MPIRASREDEESSPFLHSEFSSDETTYPPVSLSKVSSSHRKRTLLSRRIKPLAIASGFILLVIGISAARPSISPENFLSEETLDAWNEKIEDWKEKGKGIWDDLVQESTAWWNGQEDSQEGFSSAPILDDDGVSPIPISLSPIPRPIPSGSSDTKYISYLPHSGLHNQRLELLNALTLASYLNRTLIIPPIWVKDAPTAKAYNLLNNKWQSFSAKYTQEAVSEGWGKDLKGKPPTMMSWDFLFDLGVFNGTADGIEKIQLTNRWEGKPGSDQLIHGMTEEGVRWAVTGGESMLPKEDMYILRSEDRYDFQYTDSLPSSVSSNLIIPDNPDPKYKRFVSLQALDKIPQRLLLLGSTFGFDRVILSPPDERDPSKAHVKTQDYLANYLIVNEPLVVEASTKIEELLGWNHFSAHARVGDGVFKTNAEENTRILFEDLVKKIYEFEKNEESDGFLDKSVDEVVAELWEMGKERREQLVKDNAINKLRRIYRKSDNEQNKESTWSTYDEYIENLTPPGNEWRHRPRSLSIRVPRPTSSLSPLLQCNENLHATPHLLPFNKPFYLATDSRSPSTDPNLSIFFTTFPCIFTYSDFVNLENSGAVNLGIGKLQRLTNQVDGVKIGGFMVGILEAMEAARGLVVATTSTSTFGQYVDEVLHPYYQSLSEGTRENN